MTHFTYCEYARKIWCIRLPYESFAGYGHLDLLHFCDFEDFHRENVYTYHCTSIHELCAHTEYNLEGLFLEREIIYFFAIIKLHSFTINLLLLLLLDCYCYATLIRNYLECECYYFLTFVVIPKLQFSYGMFDY